MSKSYDDLDTFSTIFEDTDWQAVSVGLDALEAIVQDAREAGHEDTAEAAEGLDLLHTALDAARRLNLLDSPEADTLANSEARNNPDGGAYTFRFRVGLTALLDVNLRSDGHDGMDGLNELLDERIEEEGLPYKPISIAYRPVGVVDGEIVIEASFASLHEDDEEE